MARLPSRRCELGPVPEWVDEHMPFRGPCGLCGAPDARHRVLDSLADHVRGGDDAEFVARDYDYPVELVERVAREWYS